MFWFWGNPSHRERGGNHVFLIWSVEDIHRQTDKHGSHRWCGRYLDGTTQHTQERGRVHHSGCPLCHWLCHSHHVGCHLRVHGIVPNAGLSIDDDQGSMATLGLIHHANPVAQANATVQLHDCWPLGCTGVTVGYGHRHCLLECEDVLKILIVAHGIQEALLDSTGIAEHVVDTVRKKLVKNCKASSFACHDPFSPPLHATQRQTLGVRSV